MTVSISDTTNGPKPVLLHPTIEYLNNEIVLTFCYSQVTEIVLKRKVGIEEKTEIEGNDEKIEKSNDFYICHTKKRSLKFKTNLFLNEKLKKLRISLCSDQTRIQPYREKDEYCVQNTLPVDIFLYGIPLTKPKANEKLTKIKTLLRQNDLQKVETELVQFLNNRSSSGENSPEATEKTVQIRREDLVNLKDLPTNFRLLENDLGIQTDDIVQLKSIILIVIRGENQKIIELSANGEVFYNLTNEKLEEKSNEEYSVNYLNLELKNNANRQILFINENGNMEHASKYSAFFIRNLILILQGDQIIAKILLSEFEYLMECKIYILPVYVLGVLDHFDIFIIGGQIKSVAVDSTDINYMKRLRTLDKIEKKETIKLNKTTKMTDLLKIQTLAYRLEDRKGLKVHDSHQHGNILILLIGTGALNDLRSDGLYNHSLYRNLVNRINFYDMKRKVVIFSLATKIALIDSFLLDNKIIIKKDEGNFISIDLENCRLERFAKMSYLTENRELEQPNLRVSGIFFSSYSNTPILYTRKKFLTIKCPKIALSTLLKIHYFLKTCDLTFLRENMAEELTERELNCVVAMGYEKISIYSALLTEIRNLLE